MTIKYHVKSPGRVNLIGEHTDYNEGFVFPMAIDRYLSFIASPREDNQIYISRSIDEKPSVIVMRDLVKTQDKNWLEYIKGVVFMLEQYARGPLKGFDAVIESDIPIGAGLSSSAAFELAIARVLCEINEITWEPKTMALLCQRAENKWVGVNCGIMDQLICANGVKGSALLIDCRTLETKAYPLPEGVKVVILDTSTRRGLVESLYNERRQQCETVAVIGEVSMLRDMNIEALEAQKASLSTAHYRRARHVITENARTLEAAEAMQNNDPVLLGQLMNQSHESLAKDFEVTNEALDVIVHIAKAHKACFGARMTGAGFGGCAVALVKEEGIENFVSTVAAQYQEKMKLTPAVYVCSAVEGTSLVTL